jgi:hypothetical protein
VAPSPVAAADAEGEGAADAEAEAEAGDDVRSKRSSNGAVITFGD